MFAPRQWVEKTAPSVRSRSFTYLVAGLGIVAVIAVAFVINYAVAPSIGDHQDVLGRLLNLQTLRASGNVYVPFGSEAFTYPPGAILLFWPMLWIPSGQLAIAWALASLAALVATLTILFDRFRDEDLLASFALASWATALSALVFPPILEGLTWGQTGTILLVLVVLDFLVVRGPAQGVLVGLAAAFKIYPGLFIVAWMLRRQWRSAFTALATAGAVTALAWLLWPASARTFFTKEIFGGHELGHFASHAAVTASSSFSAMFMRPPWHVGLLNDEGTFAACALVMVVGLWSAQRLWRDDREVSAMVVLLVASTIGAPLAWDHYFSFAPILLFVPFELGVRNPLSRVALAAAVVMIVPWFRFRRPTTSSWWTSTYAFVGRNALLFASLAVLVTPLFVGRSRKVAPCPPLPGDQSPDSSPPSCSSPVSRSSAAPRRSPRRPDPRRPAR